MIQRGAMSGALSNWIGLLLIFVISLQVYSTTPHHHCIFDKVQSVQQVSRTILNYKQDKGKSKRAVEDVYQPIRVTSFVQDEELLMDNVQVGRLEAVMRSAVSVITKVLSVYPVTGPLVMERSEAACRSIHSEGPNIGKCGAISPSYREECLDNFVIPDDHLGGLWTWDATNPDPAVTHYPVGAGISDADTVLYVKAEHTDQCDSEEVLAYASYCKLDQYGRPIAGVINFCPDPLLSDEYDEDKFVLLALHESLHVLGFSSSLFDTFQECTPCEDGLECEERGDVVIVDSSDQPRIHSPSVSSAAQAHFGCSDEGMGAPLENLAGIGTSSHWETRNMYGSLMAPVILEPHSTFLDNVTLAVFEDSGWYKVNYGHAEDFSWGRGQGCDFGLPHLCASNFSQFFCNNSSSGCDYLGLNKATCTTNDYLEGCKVFWPDSESQCNQYTGLDPMTLQLDNHTGEISGQDARCYVSNTIKEGTCTPGELEGRCYLTRCGNSLETYDIRLADSDWVACPPGSVIQVAGYDGDIHCPPADVACRNQSSLLSMVDPPCQTCTSTSQTTKQTTENISPSVDLVMSLEFTGLAYSEVDEGSEVNIFTGILTANIAKVSQLPQNRIEISDIVEGSVRVIICITQGAEGSSVSTQDAYTSLSSAVTQGEFCVEYNNINYTASSVSIIEVNPSSPHSSTTPSTDATAEPDSAASLELTIIMISLLAGVVAITLLMCCLWKLKRASSAVAPSDHKPTPREGPNPADAYVVKVKKRDRHKEKRRDANLEMSGPKR